MSGELVDLGIERAKQRGPKVRLVIEIYRTGDGRVCYDGRVEEWQSEDDPGMPDAWFRETLRWAILEYAKLWRLGLVRRRRR